MHGFTPTLSFTLNFTLRFGLRCVHSDVGLVITGFGYIVIGFVTIIGLILVNGTNATVVGLISITIVGFGFVSGTIVGFTVSIGLISISNVVRVCALVCVCVCVCGVLLCVCFVCVVLMMYV